MNDIKALRAQLEKHNAAYHTFNDPRVTDAEYDGLKRKYEALCAEQGVDPNISVGAPVLAGFRKIKHTSAMLSLGNVFSVEEFCAFYRRVAKRIQELGGDTTCIEFVSELKIDGLSLSLIYNDGVLTSAATRGDGMAGEDVTQNVLHIPDVPKNLTAPFPAYLEVRGECYMTKSGFFALNERCAQENKKLFANPRNAAAGSLRNLNPQVTAQRPLNFFAYAMAENSEGLPELHSDALCALSRLGFPINDKSEMLEISDPEAGAQAIFDDYAAMRASLQYDIDGVVFKLNANDLRDMLGNTSNAPSWAIAWKFPAEQSVSTLEAIEIQVGRTGQLTPVAHITPVNIGGVIVSRASLHNSEEIERIDARIGDKIIVQRAGDVIPQIVSVAERVNAHAEPYLFPKTCPSCGSLAKKEGAIFRCTNDHDCKAQKIERLIYFASRDVMDITGLGDGIVKELFEGGFLTTITSLFSLHLHREEIERKQNFGPSSVDKLLSAIETRRTAKTELKSFINSLGIRHVGAGTAKLLADQYGSADEFISAMHIARRGGEEADKLKAIDGIGLVTASSLIQFFDTPETMHEAEELADILNITHTGPAQNGSLKNMTVTFTGTLPTMKRAEAKARAEAAGAKVSGSVSKKTDIVVIGAEAGIKADRAYALGLRTMDEAQFIREFLS